MILDNTPALGFIRITNAIITYNSNIYTIPDSYTNKKYIYWNSENVGSFDYSNIIKERSTTNFLVAINNTGRHTKVVNSVTGFNISLDGNVNLEIKKQIDGAYQKIEDNDGEYETKFVSFQQDLDGITANVGDIESTISGNMTTINEKFAQVDLTADGLNTKITETETSFAYSELRENVLKTLRALITNNGTVEQSLISILRDNLLEVDENSEFDALTVTLEKDKIKLAEMKDALVLAKNEGTITVIEEDDFNVMLGQVSTTEIAYQTLIDFMDSISDLYEIDTLNRTTLLGYLVDVLNNLIIVKGGINDILILGSGGYEIDTVAQQVLTSNSFVSQITDNVNGLDSKIEQTASSITSTVTALDVKVDGVASNVGTIVTQTAEDYTISFLGCDENYVRIDKYGIVVNEGRVALSTLTTPDREDAIIRLFDHGTEGECAIDARDTSGSGNGNSIRLKYSDSDYIRISPNKLELYTENFENSGQTDPFPFKIINSDITYGEISDKNITTDSCGGSTSILSMGSNQGASSRNRLELTTSGDFIKYYNEDGSLYWNFAGLFNSRLSVFNDNSALIFKIGKYRLEFYKKTDGGVWAQIEDTDNGTVWEPY